MSKISELDIKNAWTYEDVKDYLPEVMEMRPKQRKGNATIIANLAAWNELWERVYIGDEKFKDIHKEVRAKYNVSDLCGSITKQITERFFPPSAGDVRQYLAVKIQQNARRDPESTREYMRNKRAREREASDTNTAEPIVTEDARMKEMLETARDWFNANGYICKVELIKAIRII